MSSEEPSKIDVAALRRDYMHRGLDESDLAADPFTQFTAWFNDALNWKNFLSVSHTLLELLIRRVRRRAVGH